MNRNLILLLTLLFVNMLHSQIGINTNAPTKTLDVNGETRIRVLPQATAINNSNLLISDTNGNVSQINPNVLTANLKIPQTVLSVKLNTPNPTPFPGGNVVSPVIFDTVDINPPSSLGTWNPSTNTFTVNSPGVYQISASILLSNFNGTSANFAVVTSGYVQNSGGIVLTGNRYTVSQVLSLKLQPGNTIKCNINTGDPNPFNENTAIMSIIYTPL
ncbi:hypothetical protein [Chryseobacterium indologenes]|uniref:hypothetical protein n=1 Tax=Chryseobacterium indologenes TaxID=253 RepID=UPI0011AB328B|nr:hypothetical protein [Chryseobacterium indologenes]